MADIVNNVTAVIDSSGRATKTFYFPGSMDNYRVNRFTCTGNTKKGILSIYRGAESNANLCDNTSRASNDVSETKLDLSSSDHLTMVWEGCDSGSSVTCNIYYSRA